MLNRAALVISYHEPFIRWINEADPVKENPGITMEQANDDNTVYLISVGDGEAYADWLALNYDVLFENELGAWYTDPSLWPSDRDRKMFDQWLTVERHTVLYDTVEGAPLVDEDI